MAPGRFANLEFDDERHEPVERSAELQVDRAGAGELLARADGEYRWGHFDAALRLYTRALQEDRTAIPAWVGQVQMLVQLDECHEARVWSDKALELFRDNGELLAAKAQASIRLNDLKTGLACSDASLKAPGSSPWRWLVRGETLLARRERHCEECFRKALLEPTTDWFDRVVIARIYVYYDRVTNALGYLKEALESEPANGYIWFEMGNCQKALALDSAARSSYQRCLELQSDYRQAQEALLALAGPPSVWEFIRGALRRWRRR